VRLHDYTQNSVRGFSSVHNSQNSDDEHLCPLSFQLVVHMILSNEVALSAYLGVL